MAFPRIPAAILAGALVAGGSVVALAAPGDVPVYMGRVYSLHTGATGGCPSLDWHVVVGANNTLNGMIASNSINKVFRVTGSIGPGRKFHLDGTEVGGTGTGTVDGTVRKNGVLAATIGNLSRPSACNGQTLTIRWINPYSGNSLGGGGG